MADSDQFRNCSVDGGESELRKFASRKDRVLAAI